MKIIETISYFTELFSKAICYLLLKKNIRTNLITDKQFGCEWRAKITYLRPII